MADDGIPTIKERENGPLVAQHIDSMVGSDGKQVETKPSMALCRCGRSNAKPFCDGTHSEAGFLSRSDKDPSGKDQVIAYEGANVTVHYNPRICSHAARCIARSPEVFDPDRKPWINPDNADAAIVEAAVRACPSGALRFDTGDGPEHLLPERAQITVEKDGPLWLQGPQFDADIPGEGGTKDKVVLCRCGLSGNKPYCDGSHYNEGWSQDNS